MTPYARYHALILRLMHVRDPAEAQRLQQEAAVLQRQLEGGIPEDTGAAALQQNMQRHITEDVDGFDIVCHVDGCRSHVGWEEDKAAAGKSAWRHVDEHAAQGLDAAALVKLAPRRRPRGWGK